MLHLTAYCSCFIIYLAINPSILLIFWCIAKLRTQVYFTPKHFSICIINQTPLFICICLFSFWGNICIQWNEHIWSVPWDEFWQMYPKPLSKCRTFPLLPKAPIKSLLSHSLPPLSRGNHYSGFFFHHRLSLPQLYGIINYGLFCVWLPFTQHSGSESASLPHRLVALSFCLLSSVPLHRQVCLSALLLMDWAVWSLEIYSFIYEQSYYE